MSETTDVRPQSSVFQSIAIAQIHPAAHQARKNFNEESIKALAESMKQEGLLQPITVRSVASAQRPVTSNSASESGKPDVSGHGSRDADHGSHGMGHYELVSGERRLRAAMFLGWSFIDAKVIHTVSEAEAAAKGLVENLQREDLNSIEEAEGFAKIGYLDPSYWSQEQIAKVAGKTQGYISQSLNLLRLPSSAQEDIRRLILSRSHGLELLRLKTPEKQLKAANEIAKGDLSIKEARKLVNQMLESGGGEKTAQSLPAGRQGAKRAASSSEPSNFRFARKGKGVSVTAFFPKNGDLDKFLADLRSAFLDWSSKPAVQAESAVSADPASPVDSAVKAVPPRFPNSPEEHAELEKIAASSSGPGPVYSWIFGPDNELTKHVEHQTWETIGVKDGAEALPTILDGIKQYQGL